MAKDQAAEQLALATQRAKLEAQTAMYRVENAQYRKWYSASQMQEAMEAFEESDLQYQESNAVVDLIEDGRLDEAEAAARELLVRWPQVHDGHHRLGMVYEARGLSREAAQCYRQVVQLMLAGPEHQDPEMMTFFVELIARLDPPATPL